MMSGDLRSGVAILLVDDHPANLLALEAVLQPLGHQTVRASSGAEALRCALDREFAVILMDVQMPGMDGFETTKLLKEQPGRRHVPIIFLTAFDRDAAAAIEGYDRGAVDYLVKPFEPYILRSKVAVFVELFLQREHIREQGKLLQAERSARAAAEAEAKAREETLEIVSHDLMNPITAAATGASLLLKQGRMLGDEVIQERARTVRRAVARMQTLVADLLEASRLEGGRLSLECGTHDASEIVAQAMDVLTPCAATNEQTIACAMPDGPLPIFCDRDRVYQVLSNLVGNAIKFTPKGGAIELTVERGAEELVFTVSDTGPGIPPEDLPHIFDRYWQARGQQRRGLGLGLAIAKGLVEAHGGRIHVESRLGFGSSFAFTLACGREGERRMTSSEGRPGRG
jgi:signal transduction histidine kinase